MGVDSLPDTAINLSFTNVSKGQICTAIQENNLFVEARHAK
jgi:NAD(P)H-nitrite reductase large subunit